MADKEHFERLMHDVPAWNEWRQENSKVKPDLSYAVMRGADLMLANLAGADLHEADLVLANMRGADLRHANLAGANLVGARLTGVDLAHANICGADLSTAEDLTGEQLDHTRGDDQTKLPDDMPRPEKWTHARQAEAVSKQAAAVRK
jgi:Pentapeptide repeats (8 copies)